MVIIESIGIVTATHAGMTTSRTSHSHLRNRKHRQLLLLLLKRRRVICEVRLPNQRLAATAEILTMGPAHLQISGIIVNPRIAAITTSTVRVATVPVLPLEISIEPQTNAILNKAQGIGT